MANLVRHHFGWGGHGFNPGVEHAWWFGPVSSSDVMYVTAVPVKGAPWSRELMVKDMRIYVANGASDWLFLFTVRNTGLNSVPAYGLNFSVVKP